MTQSEKKFENVKDQVAGKAKEVTGKVTKDKKLESEGKTQDLIGKAKDNLKMPKKQPRVRLKALRKWASKTASSKSV